MAIISTKLKINVLIYDKNQNQIIKFKDRSKFVKKKINFYSKLEKIPKKLDIDLAIISTTSTKRYDLTKLISQKYRVKNFIIEKIVERSPKKLIDFLKLNNKFNIYVSIPFRVSKFINYIKKIKKNRFRFKVVTNNGTLASNGIHFADAASFVLSKKIDKIDTSGIKNWFNGKRKGFKEFSGTLKVVYQKNKILILKNGYSKKDICSIDIDNDKYLIKDNYEKIVINNSKIFKSNRLAVSIVMKNEIKNILENKKTKLPTYKEIHATHYIYTKSLLDNYNLLNKRKLRYLPIS